MTVQEIALAHPTPDLGEGGAKLRRLSLVAAVVGLGLAGLGGFFSAQDFFRGYLIGILFWLGIALGCLPLMMLHHLSGGAWGLSIRRLLEAGTRTLPLLALLFVPILFGLDDLYVWARPDAVAENPILQHKAPYLNAPFFVARAVLYFAVWIFLAWRLNRWSLEQDRTGDVELARKMQLFSGPGIVAYGLTITFAAFDWIMSLEPEWFSTIFGLLVLVGQGLAAFTFTIVVFTLLSKRPPLSEIVMPDIFHDLGKLLLAFVMVWAYFSFSQYLIIYAGNLPEEIHYYLRRRDGPWQIVPLVLAVFHFALPFVLLLSRDFKRQSRFLVPIALLVLGMRYVDLLWMIVPNPSSGSETLHWLDVVAPLGIGGLWLYVYLGQLQARALLPARDPYLEDSFGHGFESH